jgi:hypothetical protein
VCVWVVEQLLELRVFVWCQLNEYRCSHVEIIPQRHLIVTITQSFIGTRSMSPMSTIPIKKKTTINDQTFDETLYQPP